VRGFTIVEVVVALLVLCVGLLGTVSTLGSASRLFRDAHTATYAAAVAAQVLERSRVGACGGATGGVQARGRVSYSWEVQVVSADLRIVTVVVSFADTQARADTFSALVPC
jgi:type IV pilus modification protein PilV